MAEALLRHRLEQAGVDVRVSSAGLLYDGVEPSKGSVVAMAGHDIDVSGHRSRLFTADHLAEADLVLGMARMHVREAAVAMERDRFDRVYTLKEFVRRAESVGPRGDEPFDSWLAGVGAGRRAVDLLGDDDVDDIDDPIGRSQRFYDRTAAEIIDLIDRMVAMAWSRAPQTASTMDGPT